MDVAIWLSLLALAFSEVGAVEFPAAWCYKFGSLCRKFGPQFATCSFTLNDLQRQDKCCAIVKEFCDDNGPKRIVRSSNDIPKWCHTYPKLCEKFSKDLPYKSQPLSTLSISGSTTYPPVNANSVRISPSDSQQANQPNSNVHDSNVRNPSFVPTSPRTTARSTFVNPSKSKPNYNEVMTNADWCKRFTRLCSQYGAKASCRVTYGGINQEQLCCEAAPKFCTKSGITEQERGETVANTAHSGKTDYNHKMGAGNPGPAVGNGGRSSIDQQLALVNAHRETPVGETTTRNVCPYDLATFRKQALDYTNELRALHQAPPLKENAELQAKAQGWADKWIGKVYRRRYLYTPPHSKSSGVGENIYVSGIRRKFGEKRDGTSGVQMWYDEVKDYNWKRPGKSRGGVIGHFTQLVWAGSTEVGHGFAVNKDCTAFLMVANYLPWGNLDILNNEMLTEEHYRNNVKPKM